jgi:DNA-directed RNA polymerase I subunit RPA1
MAGHGAANVTLGIPRLREIVMTASQKPKTPSMTMKIRPGTPQEDIDLFCKRASRVKLSQVVDSVVVREELKVEGRARRTQLTADINFFPQDEYQAEYDVDPLDILEVFATKFPLMLKKEILKEMKKLDADLRGQIADLGKGKKAKEGADDEEAGEDEEGDSTKKKKDAGEGSEVGDGDADDEKRARQRKEQASYDSDEGDMDDPEEYRDDDLEAEFASPGADHEDQLVEEGVQESFQSKVKKVTDVFTRNLHQATSFKFTESDCTFQLEVSLHDPSSQSFA